jgi:hypothetical protein
MKPQTVVLCVSVLTMGLAPQVGGAYDFGNDQDFAHMPLKGIRTVAVTMRGFDYDYRRYGVSEINVRGAVEQTLRANGFEVIPEEMTPQVPDAAIMLVSLHATYGTYGYYSYSTGIKIKQKIPLGAGAESFITETVWSRGTNGWVGIIEFSRINKEIAGVLDQFIVEHRQQNAGEVSAPAPVAR